MQREKPGFEVIPNWLRIFPARLERVWERALAPNQAKSKRTASRWICWILSWRRRLHPRRPSAVGAAAPAAVTATARAAVPATIAVVARTVMFPAECLGAAKPACKAPTVAARGKAAIIRRPNRPARRSPTRAPALHPLGQGEDERRGDADRDQKTHHRAVHRSLSRFPCCIAQYDTVQP